jgi:hypothetical protein
MRLAERGEEVFFLVGEVLLHAGDGLVERFGDSAGVARSGGGQQRLQACESLGDGAVLGPQPSIRAWLARGATAWRDALSPLTPAERRTVVATLLAYEKSAEESAEPTGA